MEALERMSRESQSECAPRRKMKNISKQALVVCCLTKLGHLADFRLEEVGFNSLMTRNQRWSCLTMSTKAPLFCVRFAHLNFKSPHIYTRANRSDRRVANETRRRRGEREQKESTEEETMNIVQCALFGNLIS